MLLMLEALNTIIQPFYYTPGVSLCYSAETHTEAVSKSIQHFHTFIVEQGSSIMWKKKPFIVTRRNHNFGSSTMMITPSLSWKVVYSNLFSQLTCMLSNGCEFNKNGAFVVSCVATLKQLIKVKLKKIRIWRQHIQIIILFLSQLHVLLRSMEKGKSLESLKEVVVVQLCCLIIVVHPAACTWITKSLLWRRL